jgi:hypothetical protein
MISFEYPEDILREGSRGYDGLDPLRMDAYERAMGAARVIDIVSSRNDAKTVKGEKYGVLTGVLFMAPASVSGYEMCPKRTPGCSSVCLFTSGHGAMYGVQRGRLRRTYQFLFRLEEFLECMVNDIEKIIMVADDEDMQPAIRLNGTSDIAWENIPVIRGSTHYANIFEAFPEVQFYDYTKVLGRVDAILAIDNYHCTFSRAETKANQADCDVAIELGINVTVVFRKEIPPIWKGRAVVNGDESDIRFQDVLRAGTDPVYIGLKAKGKARKSTSKFIVDLD